MGVSCSLPRPRDPARCSLSETVAWTSKVYYYPRAGEINVPRYELSSEDILERFDYLGSTGLEIDKVYLYKDSLHDDHEHWFVVFEIKNKWFWSIEKNAKGIIIQHADNIDSVRVHCNGYPRQHNLVRTVDGSRTMDWLIGWLVQENELNKGHSLTTFNKTCEWFAIQIYDNLAKP